MIPAEGRVSVQLSFETLLREKRKQQTTSNGNDMVGPLQRLMSVKVCCLFCHGDFAWA